MRKKRKPIEERKPEDSAHDRRASTLHQEAPDVAKSKNTGRAKAREGNARPAPPPGLHDLIREPDMTASATVRFTCGVYIRVTHPDYKPHEVVALLGQGQVQLDPVAPGQVGTLILDGFPYTVLGYYTFSAEDADYEQAPAGWSLHGTSDDEARQLSPEHQGERAKTVERRRSQQGRKR
jgi:hypothetical protein